MMAVNIRLLVSLCLLAVVSARHPFLSVPYDDPDTSEHGVMPGPKKTSCKCGWANRKEGRIIGGRETEINQFPFVAGIAGQQFKIIFCGGTIISEYHVVTAAHCTVPNKGKPLMVILGEHDTIRNLETDYTVSINVKQVIEHEDYRPLGHPNDISLLVLNEKINFNQFVGPACLPRQPRNIEGDTVKVIGWGRTSSDGSGSSQLQHVNLRVIPFEQCAAAVPVRMLNDPPRQICTWRRGKDSCKGDSGGPVMWLDPETNRYTLVGAVSFGLKCDSDNPGVNTLISYYIPWLDKHMQATWPGAKTCSKI